MPKEALSSPKRTCFVLWLVFSFALLSCTAGTPFTGLRVRASSDPAYADVNGDGAIDILDIVTAAIAFGSDPEHPRWDSKADLNNDDFVDILDMVLVLSNFSNARAPTSEPSASMPSPQRDIDYALFCYPSALSSQFLNRIVQGQINVIIPWMAHWNSDNTLTYDISSSEMDNFINQIKGVNSDAKIVAMVWAWGDSKPDLTTPALRQKCVDEVIEFLSYKPWDGILDDTEQWVGTAQNLCDYFSLCASAVEATGKPYYPWDSPWSMPSITSQRDAVGAYGSHPWQEDDWKTRLDWTHSLANVGFLWIMMADWPEYHSEYPTLTQQLGFLEDKFAEHGEQFYSKLEGIGIYGYHSMTDEDWNAWINWVEQR